jgi:Tfp pilus assembly major pilin PilA
MKNKFLYFVLFLIIIVVSAAIYIAIFEKGVDRNSYVELLEGTATLNEKELKLNERKKLEINDIVTTTSEDALAVIEW